MRRLPTSAPKGEGCSSGQRSEVVATHEPRPRHPECDRLDPERAERSRRALHRALGQGRIPRSRHSSELPPETLVEAPPCSCSYTSPRSLSLHLVPHEEGKIPMLVQSLARTV